MHTWMILPFLERFQTHFFYCFLSYCVFFLMFQFILSLQYLPDHFAMSHHFFFFFQLLVSFKWLLFLSSLYCSVTLSCSQSSGKKYMQPQCMLRGKAAVQNQQQLKHHRHRGWAYEHFIQKSPNSEIIAKYTDLSFIPVTLSF